MNSSVPQSEDGKEGAGFQETPQPPTVPLPEPAKGSPAVPPAITPEAAPDAVPGPPSWAYPPTPPEQRGARVGTVVWGLLLAALAGLLIVSRLGLVALDGGYVLIGLTLGTGAALVIGGVASSASRKHRERAARGGGSGNDDSAAPGHDSGSGVTKQA